MRKRDEMLHKKAWKAMERKPTKGDWIQLVKQDLRDFNINESFEKLTLHSKITLKNLVKEACREYTLKKLVNKIKKKGDNLQYNELELQQYLKTENLNMKQAKLLFKMSSKKLPVKANFKHLYSNNKDGLKCSKCLQVEETQEHAVTSCTKLFTKMTKN